MAAVCARARSACSAASRVLMMAFSSAALALRLAHQSTIACERFSLLGGFFLESPLDGAAVVAAGTPVARAGGVGAGEGALASGEPPNFGTRGPFGMPASDRLW